jgi:hypothetical protein
MLCLKWTTLVLLNGVFIYSNRYYVRYERTVFFILLLTQTHIILLLLLNYYWSFFTDCFSLAG